MNILILGGDERFISLEKILNENNFKTKTSFLNSNDENFKKINNFDIIFLPIPFSKNNFLNAPFYSEKINTESIFSNLKNFKGKIIGGFDKNSENTLKEMNLNFINILKDEKFTLINAIITAEGSIEKLIHESEKSLFESKVCIIGYGRVSKALSRRIEPLCEELIIYNNPSINYVYTKIDNIKSRTLDNFKNEAKNFNIIVNTIPHLIITKEILNSLNKKTLILDLSSLPGGVDFKYANIKNIKTIHYLGIPAKVSRESSSKAIFNFFKENLK